jgi:chromosomal replication initiator protein
MVERIIRVVCKKYGVTEEDIKSKKKTDTVTNARQVAIYFIRKNTDLSLDEIGKIFGRDHSTVIYSLNKIDLNMKTVKFFDSEIDAMASELSV